MAKPDLSLVKKAARLRRRITTVRTDAELQLALGWLGEELGTGQLAVVLGPPKNNNVTGWLPETFRQAYRKGLIQVRPNA
jgi:hypothetical protein